MDAAIRFDDVSPALMMTGSWSAMWKVQFSLRHVADHRAVATFHAETLRTTTIPYPALRTCRLGTKPRLAGRRSQLSIGLVPRQATFARSTMRRSRSW